MKRLLFICFFAAALCPLFAFTDSFASYAKNPTYNALIKAVKDDEDPSRVTPLYERYLASNPGDAAEVRIEYQMVRYFTDRKDKSSARKHLSIGTQKLASLSSGFARDYAESEIVSADYYVNKKMKVGMRSSDLTKALYANYPDEVSVALQEANRILYTPPIAGGSPRKALVLFQEVENSDIVLQDLDRFSLLAGIGIAQKERDENAEALIYLRKALSVFKGDKALIEAIDEIENPPRPRDDD